MKLDRLLIETLENRILVGIASFVGIMVIIGWVTINEPARMATFEDQYDGRSIERGAYLFNENCSTCHGIDGRGIGGRAPGLNSPHMFGYDFLASQRRAIENIEIQKGNAQAILDEYELVTESIAGGELSEEELTAAQERAAQLEPQLAETEAEIADLEAQILDVQSEMDSIVGQMAPAVANGYDPHTIRTAQVRWGGSLENYVLTTLVHGRPGSATLWPASDGGMAAWGQIAGGPLRQDQLEDLTAYIMNWDKGSDWTMDDLNQVAQFAIIPADSNLIGEPVDDAIDVEPVGTDVDAILVELENYVGDPNNGQAIYNGTYACAGCHSNEVVAPLTDNQWADVVNGEGGRPYSDEPERYFVESIVNPGAFVVLGYPAGAMPGNFGERMGYQDMADILAYVRSFE